MLFDCQLIITAMLHVYHVILVTIPLMLSLGDDHVMPCYAMFVHIGYYISHATLWQRPHHAMLRYHIMPCYAKATYIIEIGDARTYSSRVYPAHAMPCHVRLNNECLRATKSGSSRICHARLNNECLRATKSGSSRTCQV